jgi:hypothetical protein
LGAPRRCADCLRCDATLLKPVTQDPKPETCT